MNTVGNLTNKAKKMDTVGNAKHINEPNKSSFFKKIGDKVDNFISHKQKSGPSPIKKEKSNFSKAANEIGKSALKGVAQGIAKSPFPNVLAPLTTIGGAIKKNAEAKKKKAALAYKKQQDNIKKNILKNHEAYNKQKANIYKAQQSSAKRAAKNAEKAQKASAKLDAQKQKALNKFKQAEGKAKLQEMAKGNPVVPSLQPKPVNSLPVRVTPRGRRKERNFSVPLDTVNKKPPLSREAAIKIMNKLEGK